MEIWERWCWLRLSIREAMVVSMFWVRGRLTVTMPTQRSTCSFVVGGGWL